MKDKRTQLYFFTLIFIILGALGGFLCYNFNQLGISYSKSIPVLTVFIIGLIIYFKISQFDWYKELTDKTYIKYKELFDLYQYKVLKKGERYDIFVYDYCNSNLMLPVQVDSNVSISASDYNAKNEIYNQIKYILENRIDLVEKHFNQKCFSYQDYKRLIADYTNTYPPLEEKLIETKSSNAKFYNLNDEIIEDRLREFVLECYQNGTMHIGDRNFGYFLKHKHPAYSTAKQYAEAWTLYIGKYEPRDNCKYISDPSYWKNVSEIDATLKSLERIENFYSAFMQEGSPIIKNIQRDKNKLEELKG